MWLVELKPEQLCRPLFGDPGEDLHRSGKCNLLLVFVVAVAVVVDNKLDRDACLDIMLRWLDKK